MYIKPPSRSPVTTSNTECCFNSMVDKIMDTIKRKDATRIPLLRDKLLCITAKWAPMELYT